MAVETQQDWTQIRINPRQKFLTKEELNRLPALYATEGTPLEEKKAIVHFFGGNYDFYAVEFDPAEGLFFGFAKIGPEGEWGYTSAEQLLSVGQVMTVMGRRIRLGLERDLYSNGKIPA